VLLVDRPAILDLFVASGAIANIRLAVVCTDGSPAPVIAWLRPGYRAGRRAPVLYLHDAATVIYPFNFEPLTTLIRYGRDEPLPYHDLGLSPLGCQARGFAETLPPDELLFDLEAVPPAALVSHVTPRPARGPW
jgi:hypothetical protein